MLHGTQERQKLLSQSPPMALQVVAFTLSHALPRLHSENKKSQTSKTENYWNLHSFLLLTEILMKLL
jgi:hypothetical protein